MFAFIDFSHPWSPSPLPMGRAFPQPRCSTHPPVFILSLLTAYSTWEHLSQEEWDVKGRSRTGWHFGEGLQYRLVPERGSIEPPAPRVRQLLPRTLQSRLSRRTLPVYGLWPTRLLCPWESPGKNTGVGCHFLLRGIFLTQGSNPHLQRLLHLQADTSPLCLVGSHCWLLGLPQSLLWELPVLCRMFSSTLDFYPLDANRTLTLAQTVLIKNVSRNCEMPPGGQNWP